ncbi:hypothetical protein RGQ29_019714 [Quercus rubra]|uniref:Pentatricopeptide repeat-containing protein n=1 Tax=Quercus rubra TaxID=3512 RepID=A0AAN7IW59_QUERU|nr:hypothetical protein RGQ29_019714 [Quercus rubra]
MSKRLTRISSTNFMHTITNCNHIEHSRVLYSNAELQASPTQLQSILQACSGPSVLQQGRQVHAQVIVSGYTYSNNNGLLGAKLLGMYVLCGSFVDAKTLFYKLELRSSAWPWNWMIRAFTMMGWFDFALLFYFKMLGCGISPDKYTFPCVIKACGGLNNVRLGKLVHQTIRLMGFEFDVFVGSSLIKLYAENGCIGDARYLFDKMSYKDCVMWTSMLNGYVKNADSSSALQMFLGMRYSDIRPNSVTLACILSVCASEAMVVLGTQLHGLVIRCGLELDPPVANTLLAMYSKCQKLFDACELFDRMPKTDLVTWNGMISGFVQNGCMGEASHLLREMISVGVKPDSITFASFLPSVTESACLKQGLALNAMNSDALDIFRWLLKEKMRPNSVTLASVLQACAGLAALNLGMELHCNILKNGLDGRCRVGSAITDMYAKCGRLDLAHHTFERMSERDSVCWNSMITSCSQNGKSEEAIDLFRQMGKGGTKYDCVSISAGLSACAALSSLHYGKEIHGFMIKGAFSSDSFAESALIEMYAKCGNLDSARCVFDMMKGKNEVSWTNIISAYGNHGHLKDSLTLFHEMLENGIQPDHVTFLAIISACAHAGQVDNGAHYFRCMTEEYGIPAKTEHYACMVDLFGRAGRLNKAFETIKSMPFAPDAGVWGTLLGACRVHGNVELAEVASRHLFDLDPQNSGYYVLLSNIHADAGQWGSVLKIRSLMKERHVQKVPGYSWIDINNITHMFSAADGSHPQSSEIYSLLNNLLLELRKEGYVPQLYLPMHPQTMGL